MTGQGPRACLRSITGDQRGATAVEYGLILALIFLALTVGVNSLGSSMKERWNALSNRVATHSPI